MVLKFLRANGSVKSRESYSAWSESARADSSISVSMGSENRGSYSAWCESARADPSISILSGPKNRESYSAWYESPRADPSISVSTRSSLQGLSLTFSSPFSA